MPHATNASRIVVIGAGHAASEFAGALRAGGFSGPLLMLGEEHHLPYQRPPLSKAFLSGEATLGALELKSAAAYQKLGVEIRTRTRVTAIDRRARRIELQDGGFEGYDKLVLATGGRARPLAARGLEGANELTNFHYLRTVADAGRMRELLRPGLRLVIIGGGYIGLEVASVARKRGLEVTVLEALPRLLARVTAAEVSAFYERIHREAGVAIRTGASVQRIETHPSSERVVAVHTQEDVIPADVVLAGVGQLPNVELAQRCGLALDNGIVVDEHARSSDPDIFAIGDCSNHPSALYGRRLRLESVPNALGQARAAAAMLCGAPRGHEGVPWFWSDQYDLKLQMAGLSHGHDRVITRGRPEERSFIAFYLQAGRIIAADAVNRPRDFLAAKRLVGECAQIRAPESLADESQPFPSNESRPLAAGARN
jgi:3-phenylpropionate/trans-cinnamate dioxygenase ferredoxin reductase component